MSLYGPVDEETCAEIVHTLMAHKELLKKDKNNEIEEPVKFIISTHGGAAVEMFAVYDAMRFLKKESEIHTIGMGKVMSAGVLLLAAGTKGHRYVGKNCRLMIHSVKGLLNQSDIPDVLENEINEIRWHLDAYCKCLADESRLSKKKLKKLFDKKINIYLTAGEAIEYGIADHII